MQNINLHKDGNGIVISKEVDVIIGLVSFSTACNM